MRFARKPARIDQAKTAVTQNRTAHGFKRDKPKTRERGSSSEAESKNASVVPPGNPDRVQTPGDGECAKSTKWEKKPEDRGVYDSLERGRSPSAADDLRADDRLE